MSLPRKLYSHPQTPDWASSLALIRGDIDGILSTTEAINVKDIHISRCDGDIQKFAEVGSIQTIMGKHEFWSLMPN